MIDSSAAVAKVQKLAKVKKAKPASLSVSGASETPAKRARGADNLITPPDGKKRKKLDAEDSIAAAGKPGVSSPHRTSNAASISEAVDEILTNNFYKCGWTRDEVHLLKDPLTGLTIAGAITQAVETRSAVVHDHGRVQLKQLQGSGYYQELKATYSALKTRPQCLSTVFTDDQARQTVDYRFEGPHIGDWTASLPCSRGCGLAAALSRQNKTCQFQNIARGFPCIALDSGHGLDIGFLHECDHVGFQSFSLTKATMPSCGRESRRSVIRHLLSIACRVFIVDEAWGSAAQSF